MTVVAGANQLRRLAVVLSTVLIAFVAMLYTPAPAATGLVPGSEFKVNTHTDADQFDPTIASGAAGNFVITWTSSSQDGDGTGIYAQRYNADGTTAGAEFKVNTETAGDQSGSKVAADADGNFVITWTSAEQDGEGNGIYAQRYNADGTTAGAEFKVNTETAGDQRIPEATADPDGNFVIAWTSVPGQDGSGAGIYAQRYNADGVTAGPEFKVNTYTDGDQFDPTLAADAAGNFVITWYSSGQDGSGAGIYAQRYNADGTTAGSEFKVNTYTAGDQLLPKVATDPDGNFVITWMSAEQDGSGRGIYAQRYNADGTTAGSEFRVNTYTDGDQLGPVVAADQDGNLVITWTSAEQDGSGRGIYAQRYNPDGTPAGSEFRVNTYTSGHQLFARVSNDADGNVVFTWTSAEQDGSGFGIYARRYVMTDTGTPAVTGVPGEVAPGDSFPIEVAGFLPGEDIDLVIESDPVNVGSVTADQQGRAQASVTVPKNLSHGPHTLVATGRTSGVVVRVPFVVSGGSGGGALAATGTETPRLLSTGLIGLSLLLALWLRRTPPRDRSPTAVGSGLGEL